MAGFAGRGRIEVIRDGQIRQRGDGDRERVRDEFGACGNDYVEVSGEGQRMVGCGVDCRRGRRDWARDVHRRDAERLGSEGVGEMDTQSLAAYGEVDDLADGGIAEVVGRQGILWFGNLLRCSPTGDPRRRLGGLCARERREDVSEGGESENRRKFPCKFHDCRFSIRPEVNRFSKNEKSISSLECPVRSSSKSTLLLLVLASASAFVVCGAAQTAPPPVTFTADQDHQNMMDQLGIKALRPGPSGNDKAPNHANNDESLANPYPNIPDPLTLNDGTKVTTAAQWWDKRRPELVEGLSKYVYGRQPENLPKVTWTVTAVDHEFLGFTQVIAKDLIGEVDNSAYPAIKVRIHMTLVTPANAKGPVPVLMMFGRAGFPNPNEPRGEELGKVNAAFKALLLQQDPSLNDVFANHPAWQPLKESPFFPRPEMNEDGDPPNTYQLVAAGWGFVLFDPASVQADDGAGITRGIIGLVNKGQPRKPEDWGALRAWAWGAGRGLDYLETDPAVDAKHVGIDGVSRYGKATLVTMAFDQRFAMALVGSSGKGGATLLRRNYGEAVESLTGGEYYWMAGNFMKYGASDATFGAKTPGDIPVDSNELIALCAPRLTFISYGVPEKGDAKWLDHEGSWMATVDASRVFNLLGAKGLAVEGDYHTAKMPAVNQGLTDGQLAWRQHDGGHTDAPNMKWFILWADKFIGHTPGQ